MIRYAEVRGARPETVARYLPSGYSVIGEHDGHVYIAGEDHHGWTLDGYVIPRLASGLYGCREVWAPLPGGLA